MVEKNSSSRIASEDFISLKQNPHPSSRVAIAKKIARHINSAQPHTVEYDLACDIAQYLQRDDHVEVRVTLAEGLADSVQAPRGLILMMARDAVQEVAVPILKESPILEEGDLLDVLEHTSQPKKLVAVASRRFVSVTVSTKLVEFENTTVALTLLRNEGAQITETICKRVSHLFPSNEAIKVAINESMPKIMAAAEVMETSSFSLADQDNNENRMIPSFTPITESALKNDLLTLMLLGGNPQPAMCLQLAQDMNQREKLSAQLLLAAVMVGNIPFFHAALSVVAGFAQQEVKHRCESSKEEFRTIYNKTGMSSSLFDLIYWMYTNSDRMVERGEKSNSSEFIRGMNRHLREAEKRGINFAETMGRSMMQVVENITGS